MSTPYTSLNRYRKVPVGKTPNISLNDVPIDEKYEKTGFSLCSSTFSDVFSAIPAAQTARPNNYRYSSKMSRYFRLIERERHVCFIIDEDAQLIDEVTSRMALDNMKSHRSTNESRIRDDFEGFF